MKRKTTILVAICVLISTFSIAQTLISKFDFNNNLNDNLNNATCTLLPNTTNSFNINSMSWAAPETATGGLTVKIPDSIFTENNYSIIIEFSFSTLNGYKKIIDYKNLSEDAGLYYYDSAVVLYNNNPRGTTKINSNNIVNMLITRDSTTNKTSVYLKKGDTYILEIDPIDNLEQYIPILIGKNRLLTFFGDDEKTTREYSKTGTVNYISIYNGIYLAKPLYVENAIVENLQLSVFPNPVTDIVTVQLPDGSSELVELYDSKGQLIRSYNSKNQKSMEINIQDLTPSVYFLKSSSGFSKIIKQ